MTINTADQQRRANHQRRRQTPIMTGQHPDSRRQTNSQPYQKLKTSNRSDVLADELLDSGINYHEPGTADEGKPTNQRLTGTTVSTNITRTDSIGFSEN